MVDSTHYRSTLDPVVKREGRYALRIESAVDSPAVWGTIAAHRLPLWFKMRDLRLRGYVKREAIQNGLGGLWARVQQTDGYPNFHEQSDWDLPATEDWTWYELKLDVGPESREVAFGGILTGTGRLWLDSLSLDVDGVPYAEAAAVAAATAKRLIRPTLQAGARPLDEQGQADLMNGLRDYRLVVLRLAAPGEQQSLAWLARLLREGKFDYCLLNAAPGQVLAAESLSWPEALPAYPPSAELAEAFEAMQGEKVRLRGIALGHPGPALLALKRYQGTQTGQSASWDTFDSLHRHLYGELGRSTVSWSAIRQLRAVQQPRPAPGSDESVQLAWRQLHQLERYYFRNGSRIYQDSICLANVQYFLQRSPRTRGLLILDGSAYYPERGNLHQKLRAAYGKQMLSLVLTVGEGSVLDSAGKARPLAPLGPHCAEYYLSDYEDDPFWLDLSQEPGWLPPYLFLRAKNTRADAQPFITVSLRDHCDWLLYLGEGRPAHPYRAKPRR